MTDPKMPEDFANNFVDVKDGETPILKSYTFTDPLGILRSEDAPVGVYDSIIDEMKRHTAPIAEELGRAQRSNPTEPKKLQTFTLMYEPPLGIVTGRARVSLGDTALEGLQLNPVEQQRLEWLNNLKEALERVQESDMTAEEAIAGGYFQVSRAHRRVARLPPGKTGVQALVEAAGENRVDWAKGLGEGGAGDQYLRVYTKDAVVLSREEFARFRALGGDTYRAFSR
jgi:hypothetical protein